MRRLLDKYKAFHVACGLAICIFSGNYLHVCLHSSGNLMMSDGMNEAQLGSTLYLTSICPIWGGPTEHSAHLDPIFTDIGTYDDGCPQTCNLFSCVVIHVSAHLANAANFSTSYSEEFPALNVARYRGEVRLMKPFIIYLGLHVGFQAVGSNDKICWLHVSCFFPGP